MKRVVLPVAISMVLVFIITFMTGCASTAQKKEAYWNSQIGIAKYDDVVSRLGPPAAKENLPDGSTIVKWVRISYTTVGGSSSSWTEELVMRFSPSGILTQSSMHEF
ncbi:MAG TPA: hypothetical protein VEF33_08310 [Syntrophales bacterium]|nr:hypothetical protein [Syntrophales bacterium]